jgi:endonuclease-3
MRNKVTKIFSELDKMWPDAHCELIHFNAFQLLIAVVMSAQATDKSVNKVLTPLFERNQSFSPEDLLNMGLDTFYSHIKSVGLAPTKSKNCLKIAGILMEKYNGVVPLNRDALQTLPGVGRKTANVVLNVLCQLPTMPVDTHVERVSKRLGLVSVSSSTLQVEEQLLNIVPKKMAVKAHHLLIFHGRYHCLARKPKCESCPLESLCSKNIY